MAEYQYRLAATEPESIVIRAARKSLALVNREQKPRMLMVGMHLTKTRGGISTLAAGILDSDLKNDYEINYIESQAEDFGKFRKMGLAISAVIRFIAACLFTRVDLVYVHVGSNASLYRESAFIVLSKFFGKRTVAHFHAGDLYSYYSEQPSIGQQAIFYGLGSSDRVIAVSHGSARQLRHLNATLNITVIPNSINASAFLGLNKADKAADGLIRLLFVGAVGKLKGEKDLIKALELLKDEHPELRVSLLGYGAENLEEMIEQTGIVGMVEHLGAVSLDQRIEFYKSADIFVLPTYAEAMPISVIEAMAAALPVITTPVGGIPELIDNAEDGFLIQPGDIKQLAKKISLLAKNNDMRLAMGAKARRRVRETMNFDVYIEQLRAELFTVSTKKK